MKGDLIIANKHFPVDAPVVNWLTTGWDATAEHCIAPQGDLPCAGGIIPYGKDAKNKSPRRYAFRPALRKYAKNPPIEAAQATIKQFVLHHDGCSSAAMCWEVLHNERGLSCHFIVDNDGTIFQTIDLAYMAYHAAEYNVNSIGVEICNRGDAKKEPHYYEQRHQKRDVVPVKINSSTILSFDFTPAQYESMRQLATALRRLLPNLPVEYPQIAPGQQAWETLKGNIFSYSGYIGHYHLTERKWDPGPFDFKKFCEGLRGSLCFPVWPRKPDAPTTEPPVVPSNVSELDDAVGSLYKANEQKADGGFFPVGPWGDYRLWHGGVHLVAKEKDVVYAPFPGRIVAARMGKTSPAGSCNFVLIRHDVSVGSASVRFFSLYMHLFDELGAPPAEQPEWMKKDSWVKNGKKIDVCLLDEPLKAGEVVGRVGKAGPEGMSKAQIHFEIFSTEKLFADVPGNKWNFLDGSEGGRFCDLVDVDGLIDTDKNGMLSRAELVHFYAGVTAADPLKDVVTFNLSEWTVDPDWKSELLGPKDLRVANAGQPPPDIDLMIAEQIAPIVWWDNEVASHCKIPTDGLVWHYHPIRFLRFINMQIAEAALNPPPAVDASQAGGVPDTVTDDFGDKAGASAVTDDQKDDIDPYDQLTPEQMLQGYDGDPVQ